MQWVAIAAGTAGMLLLVLWLVMGNKIVYYSAAVIDVLAQPWSWIPTNAAQQTAVDLNAASELFRAYSNRISFNEWLGYANVGLRPLSVALIALIALMASRLLLKGKLKRLSRKFSPEGLAEELMPVFTDIAPTVKIQKQLVGEKLPGWRRQTSPMEFMRAAHFDGVPVVEPGDQLNEIRLAQYLAEYRFVQREIAPGRSQRLRFSRHLGWQLVDLAVDAKDQEQCFVDRLSDVGQAVFAILAPIAFGGARGKERAEEVIRALNLSAYGSATGTAKLNQPVVQAAFDDYRNDKGVRQLLLMHHWEYTFLYGLLRIAGRYMKIGPWRFLWLKPMSRVLFYVLDNQGRHTPHAEAAVAAFGQHPFEQLCIKEGRLPLIEVQEGDRQRGERGSLMPAIFVTKVVEGFSSDFREWQEGSDDDEFDRMWKDRDVWRETSRLVAEMSAPPTAPPAGLEVTAFDQQMAADAEAAARDETERLRAAIVGADQKGVE